MEARRRSVRIEAIRTASTLSTSSNDKSKEEIQRIDNITLKTDNLQDLPRKKRKIQHEVEQVSEGKARSIINTESVRKPDSDADNEISLSTNKNTKRKKRVKKETPSDPSTFLPRNTSNNWKIGAHVSSAGGVENSVLNAAMIGANAFALFLKSQRKWESPPLSETSISLFKSRLAEYGYSSKVVLPHGSYLINLGNPDKEKREKSFSCFLDDLKRCETLGLELYNLHPGSTVGQATVEESLSYIAECINRAHKEISNVVVVLENMAGAGNIIGAEFSHIAGVIEKVEDKTRIGVCFDTCHGFAAGYDIRTLDGWNSTIKQFDEVIGLKYLRGMHINDSKGEYNSKTDRHENVGLGHLGLTTFHHIVNDPRTQNIPLILETPSWEQGKEVWGVEISVLNSISGMSEHKTSNPFLTELTEKIRSSTKEAEKKAGEKNKKVGVSTKRGQGSRKKKWKADEDESENGDADKGNEDQYN